MVEERAHCHLNRSNSDKCKHILGEVREVLEDGVVMKEEGEEMEDGVMVTVYRKEGGASVEVVVLD